MATLHAPMDRDGAYLTGWRDFNPYYEEKLLRQAFPDLAETAAEDMLGELPIGVTPVNAGSGAGPALSQLFAEA